MNNQLIQNVITSNNLPCPVFVYENPLLDRKVANVLSKSFVKIFNLSQQSLNVSNNLRLSILENIRKMCRIEPVNHIKIDENLTELLMNTYEESMVKPQINSTDSIEKSLDAFLIRRMKEMDPTSSYKSAAYPDVIQALINLNPSGVYLKNLSQDIIHWNCNTKHFNVLKELWMNKSICSSEICDDISIKLKSQVETLLLDTVNYVLSNRDCDITDFINDNAPFKNLLKQCSDSAQCFQICSSILNFLLKSTHYDTKVLKFIEFFVKNVKENCSHITFSVLYPIHVSHIVVLLDFDVNSLPISLRNDYINSTIKYLSYLHLSSQNDLILLLSHFPLWFEMYYNHCNV